jgi:ABC-type nitrate/sulfonate/bicarbonate transport system permease component
VSEELSGTISNNSGPSLGSGGPDQERPSAAAFIKVFSAWIGCSSRAALQALLVSFQALFLGFLLSVGLGVPLGLLMGRYRKLESFLDIYMTALLAVPMISFIPFLVIAFGLGLHSRVWIVFLFAFVIIAINAAAGVRNVDPTHGNGACFRGSGKRALLESDSARRPAHDHGRYSPRDGTRNPRHGHE